MITKRQSSRAPARCPLCLDAIGDGITRRCFGCHTRYHLECLGEIGAGCAKDGCVGQVLGPRVPPSGRRRRVRVASNLPGRRRGVRPRAWLGPLVLATAGLVLLVTTWAGPPAPDMSEIERQTTAPALSVQTSALNEQPAAEVAEDHQD